MCEGRPLGRAGSPAARPRCRRRFEQPTHRTHLEDFAGKREVTVAGLPKNPAACSSVRCDGTGMHCFARATVLLAHCHPASFKTLQHPLAGLYQPGAPPPDASTRHIPAEPGCSAETGLRCSYRGCRVSRDGLI